MPPSPPVQHNPHPWQHTLLLAGDSKNTVLAEMAGPFNHMVYSPYGQQSSRQEVITHLGFNGELREARTDWYFLGNGYRVYSPRLMRFHSPDRFSPFGKGWLNAYMYCGGEPVMRADPTGESWFSKWFFERFADVMQVFSPVGTGGSVGRTVTRARPVEAEGLMGTFFAARKNSQRPFSTTNRAKLGKSRRKQVDSAQKHVDWAPDPKPSTTTRQATTPIAAQSGSMSRSSSTAGFSRSSSSMSSLSTVSTVSTISQYSHDSGYASSRANSIRSHSSANRIVEERLNNLRQN